MAIVALKSPQRVNVKYLAKTLGASEAHLAKIFQRLTKINFVKSVRGPAGGFELSCNPGEVSLLDIYEIIDGKVNILACTIGKDKCQFSECLFGKKLNQASYQVYQDLKEIKISNLMKTIKI